MSIATGSVRSKRGEKIQKLSTPRGKGRRKVRPKAANALARWSTPPSRLFEAKEGRTAETVSAGGGGKPFALCRAKIFVRRRSRGGKSMISNIDAPKQQQGWIISRDEKKKESIRPGGEKDP